MSQRPLHYHVFRQGPVGQGRRSQPEPARNTNPDWLKAICASGSYASVTAGVESISLQELQRWNTPAGGLCLAEPILG